MSDDYPQHAGSAALSLKLLKSHLAKTGRDLRQAEIDCLHTIIRDAREILARVEQRDAA